ncbi:MAG: hypothetical protein ACJ8CH_09980, partial [Microvirga sp.]
MLRQSGSASAQWESGPDFQKAGFGKLNLGGKGRFWPKADCLLSGFYAANWTLTLKTRSAASDPEQTFRRAHFPGEDALP